MKTYENLTTYNPGEIEGKWYSYWENQGYFHEEVDTNKEPFSIVLPPPNVTGMLHMGHALITHYKTSSSALNACKATMYCGCQVQTTLVLLHKSK